VVYFLFFYKISSFINFTFRELLFDMFLLFGVSFFTYFIFSNFFRYLAFLKA